MVVSTDQFVAGYITVLFVVEGAELGPLRSELDALLPAFQATGAKLFTLTDAPTMDLIGTGEILIDRDYAWSRQFAFDGPGIIVASPRGRLAGQIKGLSAGQALVICQALAADSDPVLQRSHAPVLQVPAVLEPDFCRALIDYWRAGEKSHDLVASDQYGGNSGEKIKKRSDVYLRDRALLDGFRRRVETRLLPEMFRAFNFQAASFEPPRIGCYDGASQGQFRRHRDNATPYTRHRRYAMTLNLNTGEYEGGHLRFPEFGQGLYLAELGGAVVFSCRLLHEALPVTSGQRFGIFTFFTDAAGVEMEKRMIAEQRAAGRGAPAIDV